MLTIYWGIAIFAVIVSIGWGSTIYRGMVWFLQYIRPRDQKEIIRLTGVTKGIPPHPRIKPSIYLSICIRMFFLC